MTKIALSGASGKMGRVIAALAAERNDCEIIAGIDISGETYSFFPVYTKFFQMKEDPDVIIDFSHPQALPDLLAFAKMKNKPCVFATTGYSEEEIAFIKGGGEQIPIFFTFNMSLGINLLVDLAQRASRILERRFDVEIIEAHHNLKKDAPSGTAIMLAESVNEALGGGMRYVYDRHTTRKERDSDEIGIHSLRGGSIVGEHSVVFAGHDEVITLSHSAHSKEVFAAGALSAAIFLAKKEKGLYTMTDLLSSKE